jgi:hypothetical protein
LVYMHGMCFSSHLEQVGYLLSHPRFAITQALQLFCREAVAGPSPGLSAIHTDIAM